MDDFDLSDKVQADRFKAVMTRIVNGEYARISRVDHTDEKTGKITVHLEWAQRYSEMPNDD